MSEEAEPAAAGTPANDAKSGDQTQPSKEESTDAETFQDAIDGQSSQAEADLEVANQRDEAQNSTPSGENGSQHQQETSHNMLLNVSHLDNNGAVEGDDSTRSSYASTTTTAIDGDSMLASATDSSSSRNTSVAGSDSFNEIPTEENDSQNSSETSAGPATIDNDSKRFSLPSPETPTLAQHSRSQISASPEPYQNGQDTRWRDSAAEGTSTSRLDSVALTDSSIPPSPAPSGIYRDSIQKIDSLMVNDREDDEVPEAGPSTPRLSTHTHIRRSDEALRPASSLSTSSATSQSSTYGLFRQRVQSQMSELDDDPTAKRKSVLGKQDLQASFERMKEEADQEGNGEEGQQGGELAEDAGGSRQPVIDWDFWGDVMADYELMAKTRPKELSRAIQNGIPPALRGMMWQLMSASKDVELEAIYSALMKKPSPHEKAIIRDLNRTFPSHQYFHDGAGVGQGNLLNVMKAYSLYDPEVGYCQGMAFVVGPLLLNMPDEEAFCVLVRLMKSYDLRAQYIPDMPGLQLRLFQLDRLLEELLPAIFMHLLRQGIKSSMYASQWFMTLLAYRFPLELVCSVFDLIFAEGVEAIFRFVLALMKKNEQRMLELDFEQLLEFLKTGLFEHYKLDLQTEAPEQAAEGYSSHAFVREALQVKITPMMLDQFAAEWTEMCRQQNASSEEVEQLRRINKTLSNQVRQLEASLSQINQEHCELVKQVVATRLEKEELEDELVRTKMLLAQESLLREEGRGSRGSLASFSSYAGPFAPEVATPDRRTSRGSK